MGKRKSKKNLYNEALQASGFDRDLIEEKLTKLTVAKKEIDPFHLKAGIVFLAGRIEEIDDLILEANKDHWKVMNWAQVKADRT